MLDAYKRPRRTIRMVLAALGIIACLAAPFSTDNPIIDNAKSYTIEISASAVALYASLRLINSVLSTAMETEVSGGAVLVSGSVQPLKALEPVDDTVERVATVVFAIALISGIVSVALAPTCTIGLALLGIGLIGLAFAPARAMPWLDTLLGNARRLGLSLGIVLPLGLLMAFYGGEHLTQKAVDNANIVITSMTDTLEDEAGLPVPEAQSGTPDEPRKGLAGALDNLQNRFVEGAANISGSAANIAQSTGRYLELAGAVMARADDLFVSFAELLVAYLFQLVVFPALVIVILYRLLTGLGRRS